MNLRYLAKKHHAWLTAVGWAGKRTPLEDCALIASEVGEAANECRGTAPTPEFAEELADVVLRVMGAAEDNGIDIEAAVLAKIEKNLARGTRGRAK